MRKSTLTAVLIAITTLQLPISAHAGKEEIGNIIGGIIGGAIGNQIGGGNGRTAATIIGAIAGSMIGGKVGRDLSEADHRAIGAAQRDSFNREVGTRIDWDGRRYGSRSGAQGSFTSTREGYNNRTGEYCREYESVIRSRGRHESATGIACSRPDGSWYESHDRDVRFAGRHHQPRRPLPPPPETSPSFGQYTSSVTLTNITRQSGGQWFRINIHQPLAVQRLDLRVLRANVQLHDAALLTFRGQRIPIYEFSNTPVLGQNTFLSAYVNRNDLIAAIDIRAESFGAYADLLVNVTSSDRPPVLSVTRY